MRANVCIPTNEYERIIIIKNKNTEIEGGGGGVN